MSDMPDLESAGLDDLAMEVATVSEGDLSSDKGVGTKVDVELTLREIRAVQLRAAGATYEQIANSLDYDTRSGAYRAVRRALQRWGSEAVEELRVLELHRLDQMTQKLWPQILGKPAKDHGNGNIDPPVEPDLKSMELYLKISARRSRLLGMDTPFPVDLVHHASSTEDTEGHKQVTSFEQFAELVDKIAAAQQHQEQELSDADDAGRASETGGRTGSAAVGHPVLPSHPER